VNLECLIQPQADNRQNGVTLLEQAHRAADVHEPLLLRHWVAGAVVAARHGDPCRAVLLNGDVAPGQNRPPGCVIALRQYVGSPPAR